MKSGLLNFWKPMLAVLFWGNSFIATKIALNELSPRTIIVLRVFLGILLLTAAALYSKRSFKVNFKNHGMIFLLSLITVAHLWIQITGLKFTSATNTGWIIGFTPVFMVILGMIVFKEKLNSVKIAGIVIAFLGLVLLVSKGNIMSIGFISHKGDLLVLASAFTWSVYSIVNKKISLDYSPMMTILFLFIMMEIIMLPFNLNHHVIESVVHLSLRGWIAVMFLGFFCSGIAYVLWAQSLKDLDAAKVGAFLYIEPFVTVSAAWLMLNEKITVLIMLSGIIITAGVILVNRENLTFRRV